MKYLLMILLFINGVAQAQTSVNANTFSGFVLSNGVGDISALEAGIAGLPATGLYTVIINAGTVDMEETFEITRNNTIIKGDNRLTIFNPLASMAQTANGHIRTLSLIKHGTITSLNISITKDLKTFSYANASSLQVGDLVRLGSTDTLYVAPSYPYIAGMYDKITAISGNTITVSNTSPHTYTAKSLTGYDPKNNITLDGIKFDFRGRTDGRGIYFQDATNILINNCEIFSDSLPVDPALPTQHMDLGIMMQGVDMTIQDCNFRNVVGWSGESGSPYTIGMNATNLTLQRNSLFNCFGISSGTQNAFSQNLKYLNNYFDQFNGTGSCYDFHGVSWGEMGNNYGKAGGYAEQVMGIRYNGTRAHHNTLIHNPAVLADNQIGIRLHELARDAMVLDSNHISSIQSQKDYYQAIKQNEGTTVNYKVKDNVIIDGGTFMVSSTLGSGFEYLRNYMKGSSVTTAEPPRITFNNATGSGLIDNNTIISRADYGASDWQLRFAVSTTGTFTVSNNKFYYVVSNSDATIRVDNGGYIFTDNTKYSSNTAQADYFNEISGTNTKTNNVIVPYVSMPAEPTHAGAKIITVNAGTDITTPLTTINVPGSIKEGYGVPTYEWTKESGILLGSISNTNTPTLTVTGMSTGTTYVFRLTVTDNSGTSFDDVSVFVGTVTNNKKVPIPTGNKIRFKKA